MRGPRLLRRAQTGDDWLIRSLETRFHTLEVSFPVEYPIRLRSLERALVKRGVYVGFSTIIHRSYTRASRDSSLRHTLKRHTRRLFSTKSLRAVRGVTEPVARKPHASCDGGHAAAPEPAHGTTCVRRFVYAVPRKSQARGVVGRRALSQKVRGTPRSFLRSWETEEAQHAPTSAACISEAMMVPTRCVPSSSAASCPIACVVRHLKSRALKCGLFSPENTHHPESSHFPPGVQSPPVCTDAASVTVCTASSRKKLRRVESPVIRARARLSRRRRRRRTCSETRCSFADLDEMMSVRCAKHSPPVRKIQDTFCDSKRRGSRGPPGVDDVDPVV